MSGKSNGAVQANKHIARLEAVIQLQANREAALTNSARVFRALIQRYGRHLPGCRMGEALSSNMHSAQCTEQKNPASCGCMLCSCGWRGVADFMKDDANFGRIAMVKQ